MTTPHGTHPRPSRPRPAGSAAAQWRRDGGSTTLELAIVFPVLLLVITVILQYALWFHARSVALTAAAEGVTAARTTTAVPGAGVDRALAFVAAHAADTLRDPEATQSATGTDVTVAVTGTSLAVLPGLAMAVTGTATGPIERFTTPGGSP